MDQLSVTNEQVIALPDEGLGSALPQALAPATSQVTPTDNWQQRYAGLQRSLQDVLKRTGFQKFDDLPTKVELESLRAKAQQTDSVASRAEQIQVEAGSLTAQLTDLQAKLAAAEAAKGLYDVLATEAPDLVPVAKYMKGGTREEVIAQIADFRATLSKVTPGTAAVTPPASLPPPSAVASGAPATNIQVLAEQANLAFRERRMADYRRLTAEWQQAVAGNGGRNG